MRYQNPHQFVALFLGMACAANLSATTYWVGGGNASDANAGTSQAAPLAHIQAAANKMLTAGDVCNIRTGIYRENVQVKASGVTFQAYNPTPGNPATAEVVTISGTEQIATASWTADTSTTSIYDWWVTLPAGGMSVDETQVFQGTGTQASLAMKPEARWPNAGTSYPWQNSQLAHPSPYNQMGTWSYVDSASYATYASFVDAQLPSSFSSFLTGATVHVMGGLGWNMQTPSVTSFNGTTVVTDSKSVDVGGAYTIGAGNEYYLSGKKELMNGEGEWFRSGDTLYYFGNSAKPNYVEVKHRRYGFDLTGRTSVTLKSLRFFACTIKTNSGTTYASFDRLVMQCLQHNRIQSWGYGLDLYDNSSLRNSELSYASLALLRLAGTNIKVVNNYFHDSGYLPQGVAMLSVGSGNLVSHNTLANSGHTLLGNSTNGSIIEYNDLSNAMKLCTDGGVCYTGNSVGGNSVFRYNLIHDSSGPVGHGGSGVLGFYLDNKSSSWVVHHNIIWNINSYGANGTTPTGKAMQLNSPTNCNMVFNNTCWNCNAGALTNDFWSDGPMGNHINNNIFCSAPQGIQDNWDKMDMRYNRYLPTNPGFVDATAGDFRLGTSASSDVLNKGTVIPGVTDVAPSATTTPDLGALEQGGTDWTAGVGCDFAASPSDPADFPLNPLGMIFANQVRNPSFDVGQLANWTKTGNAGLIEGPYGSGAWHDHHMRSGYYGMQFAGGTSEISQVVTGLQSGSRYVFQCGVVKTDANSSVTLVVRSLPYPDREIAVLPVGTTTGLWGQNSSAAVPTMYEVPFVTGPSSTQATIYVRVTRPAGVQVVSATPPALTTTAPALADISGMSVDVNAANYFGTAYPASGVYVDDLNVTLAEGNLDPQPYRMPIISYPFNEAIGSGTTTYNATTAGGRDGTLAGTAAFRAGLHGNSLAPAASGTGNGYVTAPSSVAVPATGTGSFSLGFWLKINNNVSPSYPRIISKTSGTQGWKIQVNGSPSGTPSQYSMAFFAMTAGGTECSLYTTVPAATWTHYVFTIDRDNQKITSYVNGARMATNTIPATVTDISTPNALRFGTDSSDWQLDDFQAWDYALDIREAAAASAADTSQALRLKLDDASGATKAWDVIGSGRNGTLNLLNTATCWVDNSLRFTSNGYVAWPTTVMVPATGTDSFTVGFWLKINNNVSPNYPRLISKMSGTQGWKIQLNGNPSGGVYSVAMFAVSTGGPELSEYLSVPGGTWTHIAYTIDRGQQKMTSYLNGVKQEVKTITFTDISAPANALRLGTDSSDWQMDDLRIFASALSWDQMQQMPYQINCAPY